MHSDRMFIVIGVTRQVLNLTVTTTSSYYSNKGEKCRTEGSNSEIVHDSG